ncbi:hypothetical protein E2C01_001017 [Portunus trituberculatus]|uniref:Endonuclease/exonuclease/phosphatase domain-containing protein n=1 Tax=Portunus trituberculatus TaxID=210409 RepID=A0A5B7CGK0_PORTR|nr:hypothetical protein [Portunus trituberculatus]
MVTCNPASESPSGEGTINVPSKFFDYLTSKVEHILSLYPFVEIFILGDFNVHHQLWVSSPSVTIPDSPKQKSLWPFASASWRDLRKYYADFPWNDYCFCVRDPSHCAECITECRATMVTRCNAACFLMCSCPRIFHMCPAPALPTLQKSSAAPRGLMETDRQTGRPCVVFCPSKLSTYSLITFDRCLVVSVIGQSPVMMCDSVDSHCQFVCRRAVLCLAMVVIIQSAAISYSD